MRAKNIINAIAGGPWFMWIMGAAAYMEFYLILQCRAAYGREDSPIVLLVASALVGLIPIIAGVLRKKEPAQLPALMKPQYRSYVIFALFLIGIWWLTPSVAAIFQKFPVSLAKSGDIIPSVELFAQRFLGKSDGLHPYDEYTGFGYSLSPTYLPFQWFPFLISEIFNFDYRWVPYGAFIIGLYFYQRYIAQKRISWVWTLLLIAAPFFFTYEMTFKHKGFRTMGILANTIELLDVGYYFILAYALLQGGVVFRAIAFLAVLMSRFSFLFWMPFYFIGAFFREDKRKAVITAALVFAGVVVFYLLPFMTHDFHGVNDNIFTRGQQHYTSAAYGAWQLNRHKDLPLTFKHGTGLAIYFYQMEGDMMDRIELARKVHLGVSILAGILVGLFYLFFAHRRMRAGPYFLYGLKFYFAIFYAFIQVPYPYLFLVPMFLSLFVIAAAAGRE